MPKQKTHRGAAKRFSFTKTGKVKHKQMNANHQVHLKEPPSAPATFARTALWTTRPRPAPSTNWYPTNNRFVSFARRKQRWLV